MENRTPATKRSLGLVGSNQVKAVAIVILGILSTAHFASSEPVSPAQATVVVAPAVVQDDRAFLQDIEAKEPGLTTAEAKAEPETPKPVPTAKPARIAAQPEQHVPALEKIAPTMAEPIAAASSEKPAAAKRAEKKPKPSTAREDSSSRKRELAETSPEKRDPAGRAKREKLGAVPTNRKANTTAAEAGSPRVVEVRRALPVEKVDDDDDDDDEEREEHHDGDRHPQRDSGLFSRIFNND